jgi:hypothetical protein
MILEHHGAVEEVEETAAEVGADEAVEVADIMEDVGIHQTLATEATLKKNGWRFRSRIDKKSVIFVQRGIGK